MTSLRMTPNRSGSTLFVRPLLAVVLAMTLAGGPVSPAFAQDTPQNPPAAPAQATTGAIPVSLGSAKYNFTRAPKPFPNLFAPYRSIKIAETGITNSPRVEQLIHDGKLEISLQDAVELALENSVDIAVQRYYPWIADVGILKASSGSSGYGTPGAAIAGSSASLNPFAFVINSYDPLLTSSVGFDDRKTPINNPFISGTGTGATAASIVSHSATYNTQYSQYFPTGTGMTVTYDNTRSSSSPSANFFTPSVQSSLFVSFSQNLLSGRGLTVNRRNIIIANNNRKIADLAFAQQAITTTTNTVTAYWELVYARENVKVEQQAVAVSEKLFNDNKKQLEIGTMAPLDVTRAEAQLATDRQNLIVAQTVQLQDEQILRNAITRNPLDPRIVNVEIVPTDQPTPPAQVEAPSFEEALREAFAKRPDLLEQEYNLKNAAIDVHATHNALLPTATLNAQYGTVGLAGNSKQILTSQTLLGTQLVDATGTPVNVFVPITVPVTTKTTSAGFGDAMSSVFHNNNPDYGVQMSITIPIRNRSLQADNQRSMLVQRQLETQMQQLKNAALLDVRNTYIALEQDRARVEAAAKARELQKETFEAEQKKYQLGASTVYQVILTQRDYVAAQGTELRALADLLEAKANHERAVGRTLEVNRVNIADARSGEVERETLIPGTLHGQVVGVDKIFSDAGHK
ncbi:MAG TPA: TolC family protein [Candidatus Angelobacter sp.]|nr:TolC family protein [Candidatus Angelobacter sp.]